MPTCVALEFLNEISTLSIHFKILGAFLMVGLLKKILSHNITSQVTPGFIACVFTELLLVCQKFERIELSTVF